MCDLDSMEGPEENDPWTEIVMPCSLPRVLPAPPASSVPTPRAEADFDGCRLLDAGS